MTEQQNDLLVFSEELGEVAIELLTLANQISKAIRFGVDEQRDLPTSNRERITSEWNDLLGSVENLRKRGINLDTDVAAVMAKMAKIEKYAGYSKELGQITP